VKFGSAYKRVERMVDVVEREALAPPRDVASPDRDR
jgi:hypothetical protein